MRYDGYQEDMKTTGTIHHSQFKVADMASEPFTLTARDKYLDSSPQVVPRVIYQTYSVRYNKLPVTMRKIVKEWQTLNPEYAYQYYDDTAMDQFVKSQSWIFPELYDLWVKVKIGRVRADIWRLLIIWLKGGVYADIDAQAIKPLRDVLKADDHCLSGLTDEGNLHHWILVYKPGHPVLHQALLNAIKALQLTNLPQIRPEQIDQLAGSTHLDNAAIELFPMVKAFGRFESGVYWDEDHIHQCRVLENNFLGGAADPTYNGFIQDLKETGNVHWRNYALELNIGQEYPQRGRHRNAVSPKKKKVRLLPRDAASFILAERETSFRNQVVPQIIYQAHGKHYDKLSSEIKLNVEEWQRLNPEYEYRYFDSDAMDAYIARLRKKLMPGLHDTWTKLNGTTRTALFGLVMGFYEGGVYADVHTRPLRPLHDLLASDDHCVAGLGAVGGSVPQEPQSTTKTAEHHPAVLGLLNKVLVFKPGHPILSKTMTDVLSEIAKMAPDRLFNAKIEQLVGGAAMHQAALKIMKKVALGEHWNMLHLFKCKFVAASGFLYKDVNFKEDLPVLPLLPDRTIPAPKAPLSAVAAHAESSPRTSAQAVAQATPQVKNIEQVHPLLPDRTIPAPKAPQSAVAAHAESNVAHAAEGELLA